MARNLFYPRAGHPEVAMNESAPAASRAITAELAGRITAIDTSAIHADVIAVSKRLIADGIAVAMAGSCEAAPHIAAEHVREMACREAASAWGFGFKTTAQQAAYLNAISMHVLDFEPMSNPPTHAVSPTVPSAFALGEAIGASGREIVAACRSEEHTSELQSH